MKAKINNFKKNIFDFFHKVKLKKEKLKEQTKQELIEIEEIDSSKVEINASENIENKVF
jgi:hypothetical protein